MDNELITYMNSEKEKQERQVKEARISLKEIQKKLNAFKNREYPDIDEQIKEEELSKEGYIFAYRSLLDQQRSILDNKTLMHRNDSLQFLTAIDNALKSYQDILQEEYNKIYKLKRQRLVLECEDINLKRELENEFKMVLNTATDLTEEEFIKELIFIFRTNNFGGCYDAKDTRLPYSIGQIFLLKYVITQLSKYMIDDRYVNISYQRSILNDYPFKCSSNYITNRDYIFCLKNGTLDKCNFDKTPLSYSGAVKLYHSIGRTFTLPKVITYKLRRIN